MSLIVGIDLGTTNSLIGVMDAGFPILLADADGERLTPSVVHFPADSEPIIGRAAARMRALEPEATVASVKRLIGERGASVTIRGQTFSPEEISALILRKLKSDAERALGHAVSRAVITVPAYFNDAQRNATKTAGELAGFTVERIVNEPTAAALAYGLDKLRDRSKIAVFDFGGGTFDISILELNAGIFQVLSTNGNTRLGGDDIDAALVAFLAAKAGISDNPRLREAAIAAKHRLSTDSETQIDLPFFHEDQSLALTLTRAELDAIALPILERVRPHCARALADACLKPSDLDQVILVGGQTRMPRLQRLVAEIFAREPDISQHPDEAVALGATIQAGILSGAVRDVLLLDITPLSLGIETFGGLMSVIIPRNSTIPIKAGEMFTNAVAGQRAMRIAILQGEREMARDNWPLGQFDLDFTPAPKGRARVGVQFEIDASGILHVLARDTATGAERIVEVKSAVDVSDEAVEKMLEDSLEHAFDDVNERIFTEARLKADEMLPAVQRALAQVGSELSESERALIATHVSAVESALAAGAAEPLKRALADLDTATQSLAALIVEQAMRKS